MTLKGEYTVKDKKGKATKTYSVECNDVEVATFLIEVGKTEIATQADAFNQLDAKLGVILGFTLIAVVQVVVALLRLPVPGKTLQSAFPLAVVWVLLLGILCVFVATVIGVWARWPRMFEDGASVQELLELPKPVEQLKADAVARIVYSIEKDGVVNDRKAKLSTACSILVCLGLLAFLTASILMFFIPSPPDKVPAAPQVHITISQVPSPELVLCHRIGVTNDEAPRYFEVDVDQLIPFVLTTNVARTAQLTGAL